MLKSPKHYKEKSILPNFEKIAAPGTSKFFCSPEVGICHTNVLDDAF